MHQRLAGGDVIQYLRHRHLGLKLVLPGAQGFRALLDANAEAEDEGVCNYARGFELFGDLARARALLDDDNRRRRKRPRIFERPAEMVPSHGARDDANDDQEHDSQEKALHPRFLLPARFGVLGVLGDNQAGVRPAEAEGVRERRAYRALLGLKGREIDIVAEFVDAFT